MEEQKLYDELKPIMNVAWRLASETPAGPIIIQKVEGGINANSFATQIFMVILNNILPKPMTTRIDHPREPWQE